MSSSALSIIDATSFRQNCERLHSQGLASATGGNISVRLDGDCLAVTPTGRAIGRTMREDLVIVDASGDWSGPTAPTKELPFHRAVLEARKEVAAVVHGHSSWIIAAADLLVRQSKPRLPVFTAGQNARVGSPLVVPYHPSGSDELSEAVVAGLGAHGKTVILQNHGFVAVGSDLDAAVDSAEELLAAAMAFLLSDGQLAPLPISAGAQ
jgi:ribulose-5-phosphate 4-epimerase/fuculose-1-phosphate aldolase